MRLLLTLALLLPLQARETIERLDAELDTLISPDAEVETLCTGFQWSEGPLWDTQNQQLLFSDVPRNTIYVWREGMTKAEVWMKPSGFTGRVSDGFESGSNGLAFDAEDQLILCEHGDRRVAVLTKNGGKMTLADRHDGKRFNSPNDLAIHTNGDIYFTDPPYGLPRKNREAFREIPYCGVYRITVDGIVTLLNKELVRPNGIALSPDEKTLYVAQSHKPMPVIMAYPVKDDGTLGEGRVFYDTSELEGPGSPNGLKVGSGGHVFTTGPDGLLILTPSGTLIGRIRCGRPTANVAFGNDGAFLYLTSQDRVLRVPLVK